MHHRILRLLFACALLVPWASHALDAREVFKLGEPSVVVVLASDAKGEKNSLGTGVIVSPMDIVTSCRVVEGAVDIVVTQGSALRKAVLRYRDAERDLCQVRSAEPLPAGKPAQFASAGEVETGQELFIIGAPRGMERAVTRAIVSSLRPAGAEKSRLMDIDFPVSGGSLGSGLFDHGGRLVGIAMGKFRAGDNASYGVPAEWILELPARSSDLTANPSTPDSAQAASATRQSARVAPVTSAVPAWLPRTGDRWKYRLIDGKKPVGIVSIEIFDAQDAVVRERITREDEKAFVAERTVDAVFKPRKFQDPVTLPGGFQIQEISPYADTEEDLKPGQRWTDIPGTFQLVWFGKKTLKLQARVVRRESVRVPAGSFDATVVEASGRDTYSGGGVKITATFWYAAQMKRAVKMTLQIDYTVGVMNGSTDTYELVSFEPAK